MEEKTEYIIGAKFSNLNLNEKIKYYLLVDGTIITIFYLFFLIDYKFFQQNIINNLIQRIIVITEMVIGAYWIVILILSMISKIEFKRILKIIVLIATCFISTSLLLIISV